MISPLILSFYDGLEELRFRNQFWDWTMDRLSSIIIGLFWVSNPLKYKGLSMTVYSLKRYAGVSWIDWAMTQETFFPRFDASMRPMLAGMPGRMDG